jgi:hypothetical protein
MRVTVETQNILNRPQHAGMTLARSGSGIPSGGVRGMRRGDRCGKQTSQSNQLI